MIIPILALMAITGGDTLTVYDCSHDATTFQTIDLLEPQRCPDPHHDYQEPIPRPLQVLQTDTAIPTLGYQCLVTISKQVTRCGYTSLNYGQQWPVWEKVVELTPSECRDAVENKKVKIEHKEYSIEIGTPHTFIFYSHGALDKDGNCENTDFMSGGVWFVGSYERTHLEIQLKALRAVVDLSTGIIRFPQNGIRANFKDEVLRDALEGTIVWSGEDPPCEETVSEIFLGKAKLFRRFNRTITESIVMVESKKSGQYAGLVLRKARSVCGVHCHSTQISGVVVCLMRDMDTPIPRHSFKASFDPNNVELQTQIAFLHLGSAMQMSRKFEKVQGAICAVDLKTIHNKIQAIAGAMNPYAMMDLYGPGHAVYVAGSAAYVTKCAPLEATRADFPNCTKEVPVLVNGTRYFADPYLWTLKSFPTILPCSDIMPVRWRINGRWVCATPKARTCGAPDKVNASTVFFGAMPDFTEGLGGGIYTMEQKIEQKTFAMVMESREAAITSISNNGVVQGVTGEGLGIPISKDQVEGLAHSVSKYIAPMFFLLGTTYTYLMGALMAAVIAKLIVGSCVRAWILYSERGLGWWMIGAVWHTAFLVIRAPIELAKEATNALVRPIEDGSAPAVITYKDLVKKLEALQQDQEKMFAQHDRLIQNQRQSGSKAEDYELQLLTPPTHHDASAPK